ncbi:MAG: cytochrome P450 [Chitinophagales bacterium]
MDQTLKKVVDNLIDPYPEIPGDLKLPFIGSTLEFAQDVNALIVHSWKRYGNVFKIRVLGENIIALAGPVANKMVLHDEQDHFLSREGWNFIIGDLFKDAIMLTDGEQHARYRRIMQSAFHKDPMVGYLDVIEKATEAYFDNEIDIRKGKLITYPAMVRLTMKIAGKLFFGVQFDNRHLDDIMDVTKASMSPLHVEIPYSIYWKGMQARRRLTSYYRDQIKANRKNPGEDMFSQMCVAKSESGEMFTDEEIINQMIFLMMASHDTTTSTLTSMIYETAKHPEWQERMRTESNAFYAKAPLDYGRLKELKDINLVLNECLRLHPALVVLPRMAMKDFTYEGYRIPAGTRVAISTYATHIMPEIYTHPMLFDPERFNETRAEHKKTAYSFIPFGGGKHLCIGKYFAEMEAKIVMSHFVKRFKWTVPSGYKIRYAPPLNHPRDGLPVFLERI